MLAKIPINVEICAVTKGKTIDEVALLLEKYPKIKAIAENRWPDCVEKFAYFKDYQKHFIGHLQGNKVRKVVPLVDVVQSVDSFALLEKINEVALSFDKKIEVMLQVNIANDDAKAGLAPLEVAKIVEQYLQAGFKNMRLVGLMTIGAQVEMQQRAIYFAEFKNLFDQINKQYFAKAPLPYLSMGMSEDYEVAIAAGATMVRLGRVLFED